jgi:hypothetical protein
MVPAREVLALPFVWRTLRTAAMSSVELAEERILAGT